MDAVDREPKKITGGSQERDIRQGGEGILCTVVRNPG
jgi:hypothetical protein